VAKEIALFRTLHPDRPILAAIIAGAPDEAFPDTLIAGGIEPLAADLRRHADAGRLGFLKIVAGISNVPLDALVQRDAQRRLRRVTAVTLVALVTMLAMAIMTAIAIRSRNEAVRERAEAEGLVEFMLTDLRKQLRSVGRLDVMTSVNDRVTRYCEREGALSRMTDGGRESCALLLHAKGEDYTYRYNFVEASRKLDLAYQITAELLQRRPDDPERIFTHAQSAYWLGFVAYRYKYWPRAEQRWQEYRILADRLVTADPRNPKWLREKGYAEGNLCTLALDRPGGGAGALPTCAAALAAMQRTAARLPSDADIARAVANRRAWLADAYFARGDTARGFTLRKAQLAQLQALAARNPEDKQTQDQWMRGLMSMSEDLRDHGRLNEAIPYHAKARAIADRLLAHDPKNEQWKYWSNLINHFYR
jgi:hypothetical protein